MAGGIPIKKDSNKCCLDDFSLPPTSNQPRNSVIVICAREIETDEMSSSDEDAVVIWLNRPSLRLCPDTGEDIAEGVLVAVTVNDSAAVFAVAIVADAGNKKYGSHRTTSDFLL